MLEMDIWENIVPLCPDGIIGVDQKGIVVVFNKAAEKLIGYSMDEVIGKLHITQIYHPETLARHIKKLIYSPEHGGAGVLEGYEVDVATKQGQTVPIRLSATLIHKDGREIGSVGFFHDLTLKKEMEARLLELSITDGLTGLFNHRHFYSVLSKELERAHRYNRPFSLIVLDLDNFKQCNDQFGHIEGDNILRIVGETAKELLRTTDSAFRYGGDEFVIVLPETILKSASTRRRKVPEDIQIQMPLPGIFGKSRRIQSHAKSGSCAGQPRRRCRVPDEKGGSGHVRGEKKRRRQYHGGRYEDRKIRELTVDCRKAIADFRHIVFQIPSPVTRPCPHAFPYLS